MSTRPELASLLATRAHTFSFASAFLPRAQRDAVTVLYGFCRTIDDLVDEPPVGLCPADVAVLLAEWRRWLLLGLPPRGLPEPAALAEDLRGVVLAHEVPTRYLVGLIDGVASDLEPVRMQTFADLRRYCVQVAGTVGLAMCHVLGTRDPVTLGAAVELGIAMQLTNVLRDVGGDLRDGRIYLPLDDLAAHGYSADRFLSLAQPPAEPEPAFVALIRQQIARAWEYYDRGIVGVWRLPRRSRAAILLAARLYRAILEEIARCEHAVLSRRVATSRARKLREAALCVAHCALRPGTPVGTPTRTHALQEALAWLEP